MADSLYDRLRREGRLTTPPLASREDLLTDLQNTLARASERDRASRAFGLEIERRVNRLRFYDAAPYEPRGMSDAGIDDATLDTLGALRCLPDSLADDLWSYTCDRLGLEAAP